MFICHLRHFLPVVRYQKVKGHDAKFVCRASYSPSVWSPQLFFHWESAKILKTGESNLPVTLQHVQVTNHRVRAKKPVNRKLHVNSERCKEYLFFASLSVAVSCLVVFLVASPCPMLFFGPPKGTAKQKGESFLPYFFTHTLRPFRVFRRRTSSSSSSSFFNLFSSLIIKNGEEEVVLIVVTTHLLVSCPHLLLYCSKPQCGPNKYRKERNTS